MSWFKKDVSHDKRERLFFHDIINLTHGLILFFNQRQSSNKIINVEEIQTLEKEVRTLQSLIKDHFHFKHKNLPVTYDWVNFYIAEIAVNSLIKTYLSRETVKTFVRRDFMDDESTIVYFPAFYRIMNNLIKNMAEVKSIEVHIHFSKTSSGLVIETQNHCNSNQALKELSERLPQIILEDQTSVEAKGLGLESINHLALECGGNFDFEISNDVWINRIFLPFPEDQTQVKGSKKAA